MNPITYSDLTFTDLTPICRQFTDPYFSKEDGIAESVYVFLEHNDLPKRWFSKSEFCIAELGFGTGLNFLLTAALWNECRSEGSTLYYYSVEKYPIELSQLKLIHQNWPQFGRFYETLYSFYPNTLPGLHRIEFPEYGIVLCLMIGDVIESYSNLKINVDAWYLDGFAPAKNEAMWSDNCFSLMATLSHKDTTFSTFTSAGYVRRALNNAGFDVQKDKGYGRKREMLYGTYSGPDKKTQTKEPWFEISILEKKADIDVAVIGAGIAGLTTAWLLVEQGYKVTLIDSSSDVASGASGNPCGLVMPRFSNDFSNDTQFYYLSLLQTVQFLNHFKKLYPEIKWEQSGVIQLENEDQLNKAVQTNYPSTFLQILSAEEIASISKVDTKIGGLYFPIAGYVSPKQLCNTLFKDIKPNISTIFDTQVTGLLKDSNKWHILSEEKNIAIADAVVIANSFAANELLKMDSLKIEKNRGQLSILNQKTMLHHMQVPLVYDAYLTPSVNGEQMLGASYAPDEQMTVRIKDHERNLEKLKNVLSEEIDIDVEALKSRVSFRAYSQDRMPIVGPVHKEDFYRKHYDDLHHGKRYKQYPNAEYVDGLYINVGHGSRGLVSSIPSARFISHLISGKSLEMSRATISRIHPARFLIRQLKKGR